MDKELFEKAGINYAEGLNRCMGNEDFYIRMLKKFLLDRSFEELKSALKHGDARSAFEAAHMLKGVTANLSLRRLNDSICEIVEMLRNSDEVSSASEKMAGVNVIYTELCDFITRL